MFSIRVKLPSDFTEDHALKFSEELSERGYPVSIARENTDLDAPWILQWFWPEAPDVAAIASEINVAVKDIAIEEVDENIDWLKESYQQFPPFSVGPFFIYGSHYEDKVPDSQFGLQIDAATAFGSGEHGTTKGCLMAMLDLKAAGACPWNVLDMGTGSGILAIAAWKLWKTAVLAVDNDPECVRVSNHHAKINYVPSGKTDYSSDVGDGFNTPIVGERKPYDLILANILAGPLKDMAPALSAVSDGNGYVILSGLLQTQADEVLAAYKNFKLRNRYDIGDWSTLTLQNSTAQDDQI